MRGKKRFSTGEGVQTARWMYAMINCDLGFASLSASCAMNIGKSWSRTNEMMPVIAAMPVHLLTRLTDLLLYCLSEFGVGYSASQDDDMRLLVPCNLLAM